MGVGSLDAFYLDVGGSRRFCLHRGPKGDAVTGAMLYVHPVGEEMNKSRRMAALGATALARAGFAVLAIDLHGCGDSDGDFGDATVAQWLEDVEAGCAWLRARHGEPWLWALRGGALIATAVAARRGTPAKLLLWQPVTSGNQHLTQWLRTRVAGAALRGDDTGGGVRALRERLAAGEAQEVGGYTISPAFAEGLAAATLARPPEGSRVTWLEVAGAGSGGLSAAASMQVDAWRAAGVQVDAAVVEGPSFWQTVEIAECAALVDATVERVREAA